MAYRVGKLILNRLGRVHNTLQTCRMDVNFSPLYRHAGRCCCCLAQCVCCGDCQFAGEVFTHGRLDNGSGCCR